MALRLPRLSLLELMVLRTPPSDRMRLIAWLRDIALLSSDEDLRLKARREYLLLTGREPRLPTP